MDDVLFISSLVLMKMWCDPCCHFVMLEWKRADVARMAGLERAYLHAIKFRIAVTHRHIYDFATRMRSLP